MLNSKQNKLLIITFLLLLITSTSFSSEINDVEELEIQYTSTLSYSLDLENDYKIDTLELSYFLYPQKNNFLSIDKNTFSNPNTKIGSENENDYLLFNLKNSNNGKNTLTSKTTFTNSYSFPKITKKVDYPNKQTQFNDYVSFIGLIDTNSAIRNKASELAQGETDTFIIAAKIAKWIREDITYDLTTVTENPNQKATEVFISKTGVCKEITNLYVSMMRSLGIPARVVTGFAYTTDNDVVDLVGDNWGGHAWSEVLIGNTWVPFDLTYNQYGFVDATHIPTYKYNELKVQSLSLSGKGYGFTIVDNSLKSKQDFEIINQKGDHTQEKFIEINLEGPTELGFESFGYIKANIKNTKPYYQVAFLQLSKTNEIELLSNQKQMVILKPFETKEILFKYKIPKLDEGYIYTFPFKLYSESDFTNLDLKVLKGGKIISELSLPKETIQEKEYSSNEIQVSCFSEVHVNENAIFCSFKNNNNFEIYDLQMCLENECKKTSLNINEEGTFEFSTKKYETQISYQYLDKNNSIEISIPKPKITYTLHQNKQTFKISFQTENFNKQNSIYLQIDSKEQMEVNGNEYYSHIEPGNHTITFGVKNGDEILESASENITIVDYTFLEKIIRFFKSLI